MKLIRKAVSDKYHPIVALLGGAGLGTRAAKEVPSLLPPALLLLLGLFYEQPGDINPLPFPSSTAQASSSSRVCTLGV